MAVNIFGCGPKGSSSVQRGPPGIGFILDDEGNFNICDKRLVNVSYPNEKDAAATVAYVDDVNEDTIKEIKEL